MQQPGGRSVITEEQRRYVFEELCGEAEWALHYWRAYQQLFKNQKHVELMRQTALNFFGLHQRLLHRSVLLSIQKLLDPAVSRGKSSASLEMLLQSLPRDAKAEVRRRLKKHLKAIRKDCEAIEEWRNRELAHLDLRTVLIEDPLPAVRFRAVVQALRDITKFLREYAAEFYPDATHIVEEPQLDGDTLMFLLEEARKRQTVGI